MTVGIPAYFSPVHFPDTWRRLTAAPAGTVIVVNPDTGPHRDMSAHYGDAVAAARRGGCLVYGYVDTAYGGRRTRDVLADALAYRDELGLDGVFLDRAACDRGAQRGLEAVARRAGRRGMRSAVNPGQPAVPDAAFGVFDEVVVFEGTAAQYAAALPAIPVRRASGGGRAWHLVYATHGEAAMRAVAAAADGRGAGVVFVTDGVPPNPWHGLPAYWDALTRRGVPSAEAA